MLNLFDKTPPQPPQPSSTPASSSPNPKSDWKRNSIQLPGMSQSDQGGMDSFQGLRPVGNTSPLNVPMVEASISDPFHSPSNSIPASFVQVNNSPRNDSTNNSFQINSQSNQQDLADTGQSMLNKFLAGQLELPQEMSSSDVARHKSERVETQTSQDPHFLTTKERSDSFQSILSYDFDDSYFAGSGGGTAGRRRTDEDNFDTFTSFANFGGVSANQRIVSGASSVGGGGGSFDTFHSFQDDNNTATAPPRGTDAQITPKERWQRAFRKIKAVRAFGGTIEGDEYLLPLDVEKKRLVARAELLSSEREYYSRLCVLCDNFMTPLINFIDNTLAKAQFARGGASGSSSFRGDEGGGGSGIVAAGGITENTAKEARLIFGNLLQIRELTKHLLSDLETVIQDPRAKIGPVFVKLAPFLRMYLIYYQSFDSARAALDRLRSAFWCDAFISACEAQPCCNRRGLKDFMIEPVQRVPRYELLIKEVIRYTPPGHPNNPMLLKALKEVKEVADGMNLDMGSSDSRLKVASLSVQWVGVDFTAPHRMFIKEGVLIKTDRHGMKRKNVFLLFNDLMCYGDKVDDAKLFSRRRSVSGGDGDLSRSGNRYKLRFKAPLLDCLVIDDTMVYSQHGALRLRDDTPYAAAMMNAAAKKGGDVSRLAKAMDHVTGGSDKSEAAEAWDLLKSCGASMERVLESQLCEKSFMIQVEGKTLYLTASSVDERKQWVSSFADAIKNCLEAEKQHRNGQRRLSAISTKMESTHRKVVANESLLSRLTGQGRKNSLTNHDKL